MDGHWHVATGLESYGPDASNGGYHTATDIEFLCHAIRSELDMASDAQSQSAGGFAEQARQYREDGNTVGELDALRDYLAATTLSEELYVHLLNFSPERANAVAYKDRPELFEANILNMVAEKFPMDIGNYVRLYVWQCDVEGCEHLEEEDE